jgi:hypothetical protein
MGHEDIAKLQLVDSCSFLGDPRHIRVRQRTRYKDVESTNCNGKISDLEGSPSFMQFEDLKERSWLLGSSSICR